MTKPLNFFYDFKVEFFCITIALTASLLAFISRIGFDYSNLDILNSLAVIVFIIIFPVFIKYKTMNLEVNNWLLSKSLILFTCLCFVMILCFINIIFSLNFIIFFYILTLILLYYEFSKKILKISNIYFIIFFIFFGIFIVSSYYENHYLSPIIYEKISNGSWTHRDNLYHSSIAGMFKTYLFSGTGVDGFVSHTYHKLSHIIIGLFSSLINVNTLIFYSLDITIIFVPLFFLSFLFAVQEIIFFYNRNLNLKFNSSYEYIFYLVLFIIFALPLPKYWLAENYTYIESQSYMVSLIFFFIIIGILTSFINSYKKEKILNEFGNSFNDYIFIILLFSICLLTILTKISFFYVFNILFFYIFLRLKFYKKKFLILMYFLWLILSFLLFKYWIINFNLSVYDESSGIVSLLDRFFDRAFTFLHELSFLYMPIIFILMKIYSIFSDNNKYSFIEYFRNLKTFDIEIFILLSLSLSIVNYEYFKGIQIYFAAIMILGHLKIFLNCLHKQNK